LVEAAVLWFLLFFFFFCPLEGLEYVSAAIVVISTEGFASVAAVLPPFEGCVLSVMLLQWREIDFFFSCHGVSFFYFY
jgi:hypothetical protein